MNTKPNEPFDLVLANGRVIDLETYLDAQMYVGIKGDTIEAVSETPLEGKEVIDACPCSPSAPMGQIRLIA